MNSLSTNDGTMPHVARLRQFLAWLIPIAIGFALLEAVVYIFVPVREIGLAVIITCSYLCCLLIAYICLRRGAIVLAIGLICGGLLAVDPLIVIIWPTVLPALAVLPVVAVAIALPYLNSAAMYRLIGLSLVIALVVALLGTYATPIEGPPRWFDNLLRISTLIMITLLALVLLEQFRSRLTESLTHMHTSQQRLASQNERLAVTLQSIGDGVLTTDATGGVVTLNQTMEYFTGWSQAEAAGKQLTEILILHSGSDLTAQDQPFEHMLRTQPDRMTIPESLLIARDETLRYVSGTAAALHNQQGVVVGFVLAFHDISPQKRAEEERLLWERQILETQKLESLGVLAGGIAHDFNNLLTGILGNASLALEESGPHSPAHESLQQIELAALRAAELTRQMLAYAGKGRFVIQPIDLNDLIVEMAALLKASISKHVALQFDLAAHLALIEGDPTQIRQIVMNLIINASEAIGEAYGSITIKTRPQHFIAAPATVPSISVEEPLAGDYVVLEVADTGVGMDEATLARMFEPFFTTKFTGRGLGLAAVLGIVRGHHGRLQVASAIGKGTTFALFLPSLVEHAESFVAPVIHQSNRLGNTTILVVDDDSTARDATATMLRHHAVTVITAHDGIEAIDLYTNQVETIDCILLDVVMPHLSGIDTLHRIQQINPHARVILMSGFSEQEAIRQIANQPDIGFIQKPYTVQHLIEVLEQVVNPPR